MSDSIENDVEFMKLIKAVESLEREIAAVYSYVMLLGEYDDDKRLHNLQLEASRARKEIYRYIDRRVERAVLEERAKQPISVNKIKSDEVMSFKVSGLVKGVSCPSESLSFSKIDDKDRGINSAWMARQMKILGSILDRDDRE